MICGQMTVTVLLIIGCLVWTGQSANVTKSNVSESKSVSGDDGGDQSPKVVEQDIRTTVLENYHTAEHPPTTENNPVVVKLGMSVRHFNLDESESTFYVNCWLNLQWNDSRLTWPLNNTNKKDLRFTDNEIWRPDVTLYNNAYPTEVDHYGSTLLVVNSYGRVYWIPPARLAAHCRLNLIRWPYDTHTCEFKIGSWTHDGFTVDLQLELGEGADEEAYKIDFSALDQFIENSEWTVIASGAKRNAVYYACCPEPYVDITFSFTIQRNSPSYVVCVILPITIIALVNIFIFLLPPTSGEKISLASINLFIICMYLIYFEAKLPSLGDHLPLLVLLYACNLVLVGISLVISVIVLNLARVRRPSRPPQCLRLFCNINFAQVLGLGHIVPYVSSTHSRLDDGVEMQPARCSSRNGLDGNFEKDDQDTTLIDKDVPYMNNAEWILLASMIDRISFIVYAVVTGIILGLCLA
ncbi:unnamed protein product [Allacma fusca]|uniref:Uncharacterized protein n=1 Tax=Allacma fusca TaxID=39272 RepID=A0A8J2K8H3_9HEXA|nr:unnamed protein product [Allacma fusca]